MDLETAGNGPYDVCEVGWQDVVSDGGRWRLDDERGSILVNPGRPISPETMAIHHITDARVKGAPLWKEMASNVLLPAGGVTALAAHRATSEQRYCTPRLSGGAPWICTWKCALWVWPHLSSFSNQMLRYQRMPNGLVHEMGLPAHRALPDASVTAHHLRDLLDEASLKKLLEWSAEPGLLPWVPSGPERGRNWSDIGDDVLETLGQDRDADVRFSARTEQVRREGNGRPVAEEPAQGMLL